MASNPKNNDTTWVIGGLGLAALVIGTIFLIPTVQEDAPVKKSPAAPAPKLNTVPIVPPKEVITPEAVAAATSTPALVAAQPSASDDPLPLDALQRAVQPTGARPNEALFTFKNAAAYQAFLKRSLGAGVAVKDKLDDLRTARVGFETLEQLRAELVNRGVNDGEVSANYMVAIPRLPAPENRPAGGDAPFNKTVFASMGIDATVNRSDWGAGVKVAVIDSGVGEHPTFRADQVTHIDLVQDGLPLEGHGTAIASLIAGNMDGAQGVAPGAKILDVRVAGGKGDSDSYKLAQGITEATKRGVDVINVSMGSYGDAPVVQLAVKNAIDKGIYLVASAGNEQVSMLAWPAAYPDVISVSGVDANGALASFSNTGNPTLAAPAVGIPSAYYHESRPYLGIGSGTSQSAALVSGAVAAIISHRGSVMLTLRRNAAPLQMPSRSVGAGMVRLPRW